MAVKAKLRRLILISKQNFKKEEPFPPLISLQVSIKLLPAFVELSELTFDS